MCTEQILKSEKPLLPNFFLAGLHFVGCWQVSLNFGSPTYFLDQLSFGTKKYLEFRLLDRLFGLRKNGQPKNNTNVLSIEISLEKMNDLLLHRQVCVEDIRCLDINSKQCLKKLCLKTCLYNDLSKPCS